ncbi:TPA: aldolase, partial [Klebsiella pneumoniae]|nr:aldolase [Klebsiella pneumoniae]
MPSRSFVMTEQQLREEMVQIGASLFSRGYATGS